MPTDRDVARYTGAQAAIKAEAEAELRAVLAQMDPAKPYAVRNALLAVMPALIEKYGNLMAEVSAEFFESLIGGAAYMPGRPQPAAFWASVRNGVTPLFQSGDMAATATALVASTNRHVLQAGRDVMYESARRTEGVGYARMLRGDSNCAFCTTMAGRGAVYHSEPLAGEFGAEFNAYHDFCDCQVIPIRGANDWPKGYDHEKLENMYYKAREKSGSASLRGGESLFQKDADGKLISTRVTRPKPEDGTILQAMRSMYGLK